MSAIALLVPWIIAIVGGHLANDPLVPPYEENSVESSFSHEFIDRARWGGEPPSDVTPLQHPVDLVIIAHTVTGFCASFAECSKTVAAIQKYHVLARGMPDIGYNFLVGGDGRVYVGRGWDAVNVQRNQSISVSFIGNFLHDRLTENMIEALHVLLSEGVKLEKLEENYKIVGHNQTVATLSPGVNVYNVIKTWSHFQDGRLVR